ncbi:hypothetical protein [Kribbella swartbergensis]
MTDPDVTGMQSSHHKVDPRTVTKLPLPSHVTVLVDGRWRRGWLIGRSHEPGGWVGYVQYDDDQGREVTAEIPADHIAPAECWLLDD